MFAWLRETVLNRLKNTNVKVPELKDLVIEPLGVHTWTVSEETTFQKSRLSGFLHTQSETLAAYFVEWPIWWDAEKMAQFDLIFGPWGDKSGPNERSMCSLLYRIGRNGQGEFMVIDATLPDGHKDLVGRLCRREEVVGQPLAKLVFRLVDGVILGDPNLTSLRGQLLDSSSPVP